MRKIEEGVAGSAGLGKGGSAPPLPKHANFYANLRFSAISYAPRS